MSDDLKTRVDKATCNVCADGVPTIGKAGEAIHVFNGKSDREYLSYFFSCISAWPQVKEIFAAERAALSERMACKHLKAEWVGTVPLDWDETNPVDDFKPFCAGCWREQGVDKEGFFRGRDATVDTFLSVIQGENTSGIAERNIPKIKTALIEREQAIRAAALEEAAKIVEGVEIVFRYTPFPHNKELTDNPAEMLANAIRALSPLPAAEPTPDLLSRLQADPEGRAVLRRLTGEMSAEKEKP